MSNSNAANPEPSIRELMQAHMDNLTKPVGSLGNLEQHALKLSEIQKRVPPSVGKKAVYVFAADHGITEEKVSLYPKEVTCQMVLNFIGGGAAINVLARHCGFDVSVVDAGVDAGVGDDVVVCFGKPAREMTGGRTMPIEAAVAAVVDRVALDLSTLPAGCRPLHAIGGRPGGMTP